MKTILRVSCPLLLFVLLHSCNPNSSNNLDSLKGSWFYLFEDLYFELHVSDTHFIYQNELSGTEIKSYSIVGINKIKLYRGENDPNPTIVSVVNLDKETAIIEQDLYKLSLQKMNLKKIDLSKLLEVDSQYYKDFIKSFNQRKTNATEKYNTTNL
jgi:hypothetical protein